jgi:hypothetical protein
MGGFKFPKINLPKIKPIKVDTVALRQFTNTLKDAGKEVKKTAVSAGTTLKNVVSAPSNLMNKVGKAIEGNPYLIPLVIVGGIVVLTMVRK